LLKGDSAGGLWDVSSDIPEARIAVGTDDRCGWVVRGAGVAPFHFELYWDGSQLWAGNSAGAPGVTVDGDPLGEWRPITGRARIEFGRAAMLVEASEAAPARVSLPGGRDSREIAAESTRIATPAAERREVYASGHSALHKLPANLPAMRAGESFADDADDRTRVAADPAVGTAGDNATRVLSLEEAEAQRRAGPPPGTGAGLGLGVGAGVRRVAEPTPLSEEATRMAASPLAGGPLLGGVASPAGPPGVGALGSPAVGLAGPSLGGPGLTGPGLAGPGAFAGAPQAPPAAAGAGLAGPVAGGASPFAAPPPPAPNNTTQALEKINERLKTELAKPKLSQPPRTWLLLALVVAVLVFFVLDSSGEEEADAGPRGDTAAAGPAASGATAGGAAGAVAPGAAVGAGLPTAPPLPGADRLALQQLPGLPLGLVGTSGTWDPASPPPAGSTPLPDGGVLTPERVAADLVLAGRWHEALPRYRALAQAHPENPSYAQIAEILQRRLRAQCRNGLLPNGAPCPP
jgi:hypothetical protein